MPQIQKRKSNKSKSKPVERDVEPVASARPVVSDLTDKIDAAIKAAQKQINAKPKRQYLICHACGDLGCTVDPHWHDEDDKAVIVDSYGDTLEFSVQECIERATPEQRRAHSRNKPVRSGSK